LQNVKPLSMTTADPSFVVKPILSVNNIEVIYDHVILVLKGVSLEVLEGGIVAILGANGAGKSTTLKSVSNLIHAERGEVTKGSIEFKGERVDRLTPNELVKRGCIQVMEGRHCFAHLTIEENLLTGAFTRRDGRGAVAESLERVYAYFPRLKERRNSQAGYTSGGEQQMCAIGRALMSEPQLLMLDEPSLGLAPKLVDEIFEFIADIARQGVTILLVGQNVNYTLQVSHYGYVMETGRITLEGTSQTLMNNEFVRRAYLGVAEAEA
jgi:branched-chain amino acid transport system ATP-binding protein